MITTKPTLYVGHASAFDYQNQLYIPLKQSSLAKQYELLLPHENKDTIFNTKEIIKNTALFLAEVSYPSTGLGIELGWANVSNRRILCIHQETCQLSSSLRFVAETVIAYSSTEDMIDKIKAQLDK